MIGGSALASRAIGDAGPRARASEWGGLVASAAGAVPVARDRVRRTIVRKP